MDTQYIIKTLRDKGFIISERALECDNKFHRCKTVDRPDVYNGSYIVFHSCVVFCHNFRTFFKYSFYAGGEKYNMTEEQKIEYKKELELFNEEKEAFERAAMKKASDIFFHTKVCESHGYLSKKMLDPVDNLRIASNGKLIVPLYTTDGEISSIQMINPEGNKRFMLGGKTKGCFFNIGKIEGAEKIFIAEGLATAMTVEHCIGYPTLAAFTAYNLAEIGKYARAKNNNAEIIICADNDFGNQKNTGIEEAQNAAVQCNGSIAIAYLEKDGQQVKCDFNDVYCEKGKDEVVRQLVDIKRPFGYQINEDILPKNFSIKFSGEKEGLYYEGYEKKEYICSPLLVLGQTRDSNKNGWGLYVQWRDPDQKLHSANIQKSSLGGEQNKLWLNLLLNGGLNIGTAKNSTHLIKKYLIEYETKRRIETVKRTGWHNGAYVFCDQVIGNTGIDYLYDAPMSKNMYLQSGTLQDWKDTIGTWALGNSRLMFAICIALASSLIDMRKGGESGGFNFRGASSSGKTTALLVGASCCGKATIEDGYIKNWRSTSNGLEGLAAAHSDSLLCLDELGQAPSLTIANVAYLLANGTGKGRANIDGTAREHQSWRVMFLSTGEIGLEEAMRPCGTAMKAGQEIRMIDISADAGRNMGIFEDIHDFKDANSFSDTIRAIAGQNYGCVFKKFIEFIAPKRDFIKERLEKLPNSWKKECGDNADGQVLRVAFRFYLCSLAGELAIRANLLPWKKGNAKQAALTLFSEWLKERGSNVGKENIDILNKLNLFIEANGSSRFQNIEESDNARCINRAGFVSIDGDDVEYYILKETFRTEIFGDTPYSQASKVLMKLGVLAGGEGYMTKKRLPGLGIYRCYVILGNKLGIDINKK